MVRDSFAATKYDATSMANKPTMKSLRRTYSVLKNSLNRKTSSNSVIGFPLAIVLFRREKTSLAGLL